MPTVLDVILGTIAARAVWVVLDRIVSNFSRD